MSIHRTAILFVCVLTTVVLSGCSSAAPTPAGVLEEIGANLVRLRSGIVDLRITVEPTRDGRPPVAGFALLGSFEWRNEVPLPVVDLTFSDVSSERSFDHRLVSDGKAVFVRSGGRFYRAPLGRVDPDGSLGETDGLFAGTHLEDWIGGARLSEGQGLDGREVTRIAGQLRVDPGLTQLVSIVTRLPLGDPVPVLDALDPPILATALESATVEVVSGAEDRQLRRLLVEVELTPDSVLARSRGWDDAGSIVVDLGISEPNRPVDVERPEEALPIHEMEGGWP